MDLNLKPNLRNDDPIEDPYVYRKLIEKLVYTNLKPNISQA